MVYTQKFIWNLEVINPVSNEVILSTTHNTIDEIYESYPKIPLNTWRNICVGRSKIYNNFISIRKELKKTINEVIKDTKKNEGFVLTFD